MGCCRAWAGLAAIAARYVCMMRMQYTRRQNMYPGGGGFRAGENMNLQILAQQNVCHFLKMSKQIMYGSQNTLLKIRIR